MTPALSALMLLVMFVVDGRWVGGRTRHQCMTLDRAYTDEEALIQTLRSLLGASLLYPHLPVNDWARLRRRYWPGAVS